jgi:predicted AAA+ superfamily ATPase
MAGRKVIYEMYPLSFPEFIEFRGFAYSTESEDFFHYVEFSDPAYQQLKEYYQEYLEYGGLPKVVLTPDITRKKVLLEEIFSSYINIDVQTLADFKSTNDLRRVIKLLASRVGSRLNVAELSSITGLSRVTVDNYIQFLEQTYLIRTIPAFSRSVDVQTRLLRKPYFIDTGIANVNADLSSGSKFENTVCNQLSFWEGKLSYYSDRDGEIDFIVDNGNEQGAFEVKETPTENDYRTLVRRAEKLGITKCRVIGREPSATFDNILWGGFIK